MGCLSARRRDPRSFCLRHPASTELNTLSLHDALPISAQEAANFAGEFCIHSCIQYGLAGGRSEEHTSELQSRENLVCRLLLEKKKHNLRRGFHLGIGRTFPRFLRRGFDWLGLLRGL